MRASSRAIVQIAPILIRRKQELATLRVRDQEVAAARAEAAQKVAHHQSQRSRSRTFLRLRERVLRLPHKGRPRPSVRCSSSGNWRPARSASAPKRVPLPSLAGAQRVSRSLKTTTKKARATRTLKERRRRARAGTWRGKASCFRRKATSRNAILNTRRRKVLLRNHPPHLLPGVETPSLLALINVNDRYVGIFISLTIKKLQSIVDRAPEKSIKLGEQAGVIQDHRKVCPHSVVLLQLLKIALRVRRGA